MSWSFDKPVTVRALVGLGRAGQHIEVGDTFDVSPDEANRMIAARFVELADGAPIAEVAETMAVEPVVETRPGSKAKGRRKAE